MSDLITVFRSADPTAADDASEVLDLLADAGLNPALFTEDAPGVPVGVCEVRVPAEEEARALELIDEACSAPLETGDASHSLDLVSLYQGAGTTGEIEALSIRAVLDACHIPSVIVGTSTMPNLPFEVRVPAALEEQARAAVAEAAQGAETETSAP